MKKRTLFLVIFLFSFINIAVASQQKIQLYKELNYGMSKNDVLNKYQLESNPQNNSELYGYNQKFLDFEWDMLLTFDSDEKLESVYLETKFDENANKFTSLMSALGKNFSAVYIANDDKNIDLFYIVKTKGNIVCQKIVEDFMMESFDSSSSLNIININNESLQQTLKTANSYIDLLQKSPLNTRQAEIIIQSYGDGSFTLAVDFSAPKMLIQKMQNKTYEQF